MLEQARGSPTFPEMRLISHEEYQKFIAARDSVVIENTKVVLPKTWTVRKFAPAEFVPEEWTVWSFPQRGDWATHSGDYRGNWSPFIPRNLIQKFTLPGELVCDPMAGSGTSLVECRLMGRRGIGVDINLDAAMVAMNRLDFNLPDSVGSSARQEIKMYLGDARSLDKIEDESVDLVATHPPYCDIISYSGAAGDLSTLNLKDFISEMGKVASECFRVLKPDKHCAILIGDTRKHRHYVPIHIGVLGRFLDTGFVLKEDIIKLQHNTLGARVQWAGRSYDFYKIAHEHLYVFRKPRQDEGLSVLEGSRRWW
jgi:DNA modification methylase